MITERKTMTNEELIAEAEAWMDADYDHDPRVLPDLITALRAAEAREKVLREALQWIESRGSPQSYADMPHRLSEVMAEIARRALGGGNETE
jgi:acetylornithine deacetylase/succinyl-diaminopimelate desuccinylase-like protein